jgi:TolA-binding protein
MRSPRDWLRDGRPTTHCCPSPPGFWPGRPAAGTSSPAGCRDCADRSPTQSPWSGSGSTALPSAAPGPTRIYASNSSNGSSSCDATDTHRPEERTDRTAQADVDKLKARLAQANTTIDQLADLRTQARARLAAQHEEILRLRAARQAEGQRHPPARAATEDHRPMLTRRMRSPLRRGSGRGHPFCLRELRLTNETLVSRLFRDAASGHGDCHGMAAANEICPSNPSDFAMSR